MTIHAGRDAEPPLSGRTRRHCPLLLFVLSAALLTIARSARHVVLGANSLLCLSLSPLLIAARSAGREFLSLSLKELAFYLIALAAIGMMWPGAQLALSVYEVEGFVVLGVFMTFVFALSVVLAVLSAHLLAGQNDDT